MSPRWAASFLPVMLASSGAFADPSTAPSAPPHAGAAIVDRVAVRYYASETGGSIRPRFVTERTLGFETRLEVEAEGTEGPVAGPGGALSGAYPERFVRTALELHVAEELLAALQIQSGVEPPELPKLATAARDAMVERVGGEDALRAAAEAEGVGATEIDAILRRKARAAYYLDHDVSPILHPSEEQLREVFRTSAHPFKGKRFEAVHDDLLRWFVAERLRVAETSYLQSARNRVKIVMVPR